MDSEQESEGRRDSDATLDESEIGSSKSSEYSQSISSSSSGSSSDDYIQVDPKIVFNSVPSGVESSKSHSDAKLISQSDTCHQLEESSKTSTSSTSQVSDVTHESAFPTMSPTQSPSIQVMERQAVFDPNRIPSSVFGSKDSSSKEWSSASNESLFSIHTAGNGSPARDDIVMTDGDFKRSKKRDNSCAALDKYEEINKSGKPTRFRQPLPAAKGRECKEKIHEKGRNVNAVNNLLPAGSDEPTKRVVRFREEIKVGDIRNHSAALGLSDGNKGFRDSCTAVCHSDGNGTSSVFPIKKKSSWWSCCCSCSSGSCCSSWPSCSLKCSGCSCKWLSCSGCSCKWLSCSGFSFKWLSCSSFSCKWLSCSGCSCKWPSCSGCSCKWPSCSGCSCKWPSCSGCSCKWPSCAGCSCKWPSMPVGCCKWPCSHGGCCKWPSCQCKCFTSLRCCS
ncbi:PREDICTED: uncharacterized protein LOC109222776 [Nicotiana attenuata]|uniref:uncharacterized protein LOC109222776 n=1 Tax=Nicotiana attenuata TaxID=49451 RepID=UPI0009047853|nr:PREDICTED: uncharacterized protein LOC109222776 [Nicotiana attenuata]